MTIRKPEVAPIAVIDVGLGNVGALTNILRRVSSTTVARVKSPSDLGPTEKLVLPGVGAFDEGVRKLTSHGWFSFLREDARDRQLLGVCLGMQLLGRGSQEGELAGLGLMDFTCKRLTTRIVPHMGWNTVRASAHVPELYAAQLNHSRFYFAHSYAVHDLDDEQCVAICQYETESFPVAVQHGSVVGFQFHPEKSHKYGFDLLTRWAER